MQFKSSVLFLVLAIGSAASSPNEPFCVGYQEGYKAGYEQTTGSTPTPMSPICPMKRPDATGKAKSDYELGYDRGFKDGVRDGSR